MSEQNFNGTLDTKNVQPEDQTQQTQVGGSVEQNVEPTMQTTTTEPNTTETNTTETNAGAVVNSNSSEPVKYNIAGLGEFTADEIREFKNGSMRQADYTRKTQELARQRGEMKDALELFNYVRANPELVEAMREAEADPAITQSVSPENEMLQAVFYKQKELEINMQIEALKQKYGDVDEVALFNKANELGVTDLEFVYKALNYDNGVANEQAIVEKVKKQMMEDLQKNQQAVSTNVTTQTPNAVGNVNSLTPEQRRVAVGMGLSEEEYMKWI